MSATPKKSDAKQRILETAERLFYAEGIRAVGIDRIIAEASVAKMTLYKHFPSKDDLVVGVLRYRDEKFNQYFTNLMDKHKSHGANAFDSLFLALEDWFSSDNFRGCAFINASLELANPNHPGSIFSAEHKVDFAARVQTAVTKTYGQEAATHLPAINLMIEGAMVTACMQQTSDPAKTAKVAAKTILESLRK